MSSDDLLLGEPTPRPERFFYVCDGCGAEHPQLWALQHAEDCPPSAVWHIEGRPS